MEAKEWIQAGFEASQIGTWRQAIPNARNASTYMKNIACVDAAQWFDVGLSAEEANYFEQGGWKYLKTVKWMHTNEVDFNKFRQFIHYSSNPDKILEWSQTKFPSSQARQWMTIEVDIPLATTLANTMITPLLVMEFLDARYTLEETVPLLFKGIPMDKAPSLKQKRGDNMSYSEKIKKGIPTGLTDRGIIPFKESLQEHVSQGNPFKSIPRSQVNYAMQVHVANLRKETILECVQYIYDKLDRTIPTIRVGQMWTTDQGFLDIGFLSETLRDKALEIIFTYQGNTLHTETTTYVNSTAKWITFINLPMDKSIQWTMEALVKGLSYYGEVIEAREEGRNKDRIMLPNAIHLLVELAPTLKARGHQIP
ncbi:hypothetical protein DSO57_1005953 [Entomophthora muscae]|uniref:Uncharacterized protein n=1 Tax=Entomophthora muscae TaxID=34485 RepID=A0ACC2TWC4_9FUNG|nr:hypothetical protein DSO57_1005953 [Entomophthora muscae]